MGKSFAKLRAFLDAKAEAAASWKRNQSNRVCAGKAVGTRDP